MVRPVTPTAMQLYSMTPKGNEVVRRLAWCPTHGTRSSKFIGVGDGMWLFTCVEKGHHTFSNYPDPHAPTTPGGIEEWKAEQRQRWLKEKTGQ